MYVVINKITDEVAVIKEKSPLAKHIGVSLSSIYRKSEQKVWETDEYIVYKATILMLKSNRGGGGNPQNLRRGGNKG